MRQCIAVISGGLDGMLAVRIMQEQGIQVHALHFRTVFMAGSEAAARAAEELGASLTVVEPQADYFDLIREPRFGYGRGVNPCLDCRIYMLKQAARVMEQRGADFLVSGEILGQRAMSQKRQDLDTISHHADLDDLLLRPLSAQRLLPTRPEREGWVDRNRLCGFVGSGRKGLIALARKLGIRRIPAPTGGCLLTEAAFATKVHDLIARRPYAGSWDYELLTVGRHFHCGPTTRIVVGRNADENARLDSLHRRIDAQSNALLIPANYRGASALVVGPFGEAAQQLASGLLARYGKSCECDSPCADVFQHERCWQIPVKGCPEAETIARQL